MTNGQLSATPSYVQGYIRKDGAVVPPHLAKRHRKIETMNDPNQAGMPLDGTLSPLNEFLAKHGGTAHVRATLDKMSAEQRAKLIDAMAGLDGIEPGEVIEKLGLCEPEPVAPPAEVVETAEPAAEEDAPEPEDGARTRRETLAKAMAADPHSDETLAILRDVAARELPPIYTAIAALVEGVKGDPVLSKALVDYVGA